MKIIKTFIASVILCSLPMISDAEELKKGRVCLAPLPDAKKYGPAPWEIISDDGSSDFFVQIDGRKPQQLSTSRISWVSEIKRNKPHFVSILKGNKVVQSFKFVIGNEFKNKNKPDLCLYVNGMYFSWRLSAVEGTGN